ncbi:MAG: protein TolR [Gammaproteobacteria bacterium]
MAQVTGRRKGGRRKPMSEINVVPYIDVTLVLLIIFMVTAPMLQTGVDVDLPQAEAKTVEADDGNLPVVVSIDSEGHYYLSVDGGDAEPVSLEEVSVRVSGVLSAKPQTQVYIKGDNAVDYGKVVSIMAALKNAGVPNVGLMTRPEEG